MTLPLSGLLVVSLEQAVAAPMSSISPYGAFKSRDGVAILISIQNDREWQVLAEKVLGDAALATDPDFATNVERVKRRGETDGRVAKSFAMLDAAVLEQVRARQHARGPVAASASAPHQRRHAGRAVSYPAPPRNRDVGRGYGAVPAVGEHTEKVRAEFMAAHIS